VQHTVIKLTLLWTWHGRGHFTLLTSYLNITATNVRNSSTTNHPASADE